MWVCAAYMNTTISNLAVKTTGRADTYGLEDTVMRSELFLDQIEIVCHVVEWPVDAHVRREHLCARRLGMMRTGRQWIRK